MRATEQYSIAIGAIALSAIFAGCSATPSPEISTGPTAATSSQSNSAETRVTGTGDPTGTSLPEGYVDMGHGMSAPSGGPGDCKSSASIYIASQDEEYVAEILLPENLVDMGPLEFAKGEVNYDLKGRVSTYTVAAGDVLGAIGNRLCIDNGIMLGDLNGRRGYESIQPGEVLVVDPETVPGWEYSPS